MWVSTVRSLITSRSAIGWLDAPSATRASRVRPTTANTLDARTAFAIVATADHHSYPGLAGSEEARLGDVWNAGQAHWVSLASSVQLISVDHSSHNIELDRPGVVLDMIHELLQ